MEKQIGRRRLFKQSSLVGLGVVAAQVARANTPPQTEGPFYPISDRVDKDVDLTNVEGRSAVAEGEVVIVKGHVYDETMQPLSGAVIDVWQACATGRYSHPQDPNRQARLDPNFQYFARLMTDNRGAYRFRTIIPGAYPATSTWMRPPHIHFRIDAWGKPRLTTQMYFAGNEHNAGDRLLVDTARVHGAEARDSLIVDFSQQSENDVPVGTFNIVLGGTPEAD